MDNIDLYEMTKEEIDAFINYQDKPRLINIFNINLYKYKYTLIFNVYIAVAIMYLYFTNHNKSV